MPEYITLLGAESVQSAARNMQDAAASMNNAARSIAYALQQHQRFMDDWLRSFEAVVEKISKE